MCPASRFGPSITLGRRNPYDAAQVGFGLNALGCMEELVSIEALGLKGPRFTTCAVLLRAVDRAVPSSTKGAEKLKLAL